MTQLAPPYPGGSSVRCALTLTIGSPAEVVLQVAAAHGPGRVVLDGLEAVLQARATHVRVVAVRDWWTRSTIAGTSSGASPER